MKIEPFIHRLQEAIVKGPVSQTTIAEYCGVTKQSVGGWKRNGYISKENLMKLSEVTGYRYLWLKHGIEPKRVEDPEQNLQEYHVEEHAEAYVPGAGSVGQSAEGKELIEAIAMAGATNKISKEALLHLARFFREITKS